MRLNATERILLNNPARRLVQEFYEAPLLLRMAVVSTVSEHWRLGVARVSEWRSSCSNLARPRYLASTWTPK
jgi:hypothetical protein